jgi:hypothetical protein
MVIDIKLSFMLLIEIQLFLFDLASNVGDAVINVGNTIVDDINGLIR